MTGKVGMALGMIVLAGVSSGCINHYIAKDYGQYLASTEGKSALPSTKLESEYALSPATEKHAVKVRSATVGIANAWVVEFGKMLDAQLQAKDVQKAFGKLAKARGETATGARILFDLVQYRFADFGAHVAMKISLSQGGTESLAKTYEASGKPQGGKMTWGGAFAMRNAVQQSTKLAIDEILKSFISDVNALPAGK